MKARRTIVLTAGILAAAVVAATAAFGWRPLRVALLRRAWVVTFRSDHRLGRDSTPIRGDVMDWVLHFGGRSGLPAIRALEADASMNPSGREYAATIREAIESGAHVRFLERVFAEGSEVVDLCTHERALCQWMLERDRPFYPPAPGPDP